MDSDIEWTRLGNTDPYYGVFTHDRFRKRNLTDAVLEEFYDSGKRQVEHLYRQVRTHIDKDFRPRRILDFGCGTGRLLLPLSRGADVVVGLDVSDGMLREAKMHCAKNNLTNVTLRKSDDALSSLNGEYDFIHSCIVLQHLPVRRGRALFQRLLERLSNGGVCAMQVTYAHARHVETFGRAPTRTLSGVLVRMKSAVRTFVSHTEARIEMNSYNMSELLFLMQRAGVARFFSEFTDHGGYWGVYMHFQKTKQA